MRACEEYEDLVSAFIDGVLPEEDRGRLMEHMASCPACQAYFDDQIAMHDAYDRAAVQPPADLTAAVMEQVRLSPRTAGKRRARIRWQGWAALAACCAVAVLGLWRLQEQMKWGRIGENFSEDACVTADAGTPALYAARSAPEEEEEAAPTPEPEAPAIAPASAPEAGTGGSADANTPEAFALPAPAASAAKSSGEEQPSLFETLPETFLFASGAGAWRTQLHIASDGSFTGTYTNSNAGWEGHPAEQYYCNFFGQFSQPEQVSEFVWSATVISLEMEDTPGETTYVKADNLNLIASTPYGLENANEVLFYLPGAALADLPEAFRNWTHAPAEGTLDFYGLYNVEEELGFSGYDG